MFKQNNEHTVMMNPFMTEWDSFRLRLTDTIVAVFFRQTQS